MKFDLLCNIILEGKKSQQFAQLMIANPAPVFTLDDVLKDNGELKTYLHHKSVEGEPVDNEREARRSVRRINWVARSIIKAYGRRGLSLRKLHETIMVYLWQYLEKVLRYSDEDVDALKMPIAKEAALIGNLMLPPSNRYPNAKGVFVADIEKTAAKNGELGKKKQTDIDTNKIIGDFNLTVDEYMAVLDPDLIATIKDIIRTGAIKKKSNASVEPENQVDAEVEQQEETEERLNEESVDSEVNEVKIEDILKDPRIKNVYDTRVVRQVIKDMIELGSITSDENGVLNVVPAEETEHWKAMQKAIERKKLEKMEDLPKEKDVEELASEFDSDDEEVESDTETEDEENIEPEIDDSAAERLGYGSKSKEDTSDVEEDEEEKEQEEEKEAESWYK